MQTLFFQNLQSLFGFWKTVCVKGKFCIFQRSPGCRENSFQEYKRKFWKTIDKILFFSYIYLIAFASEKEGPLREVTVDPYKSGPASLPRFSSYTPGAPVSAGALFLCRGKNSFSSFAGGNHS